MSPSRSSIPFLDRSSRKARAALRRERRKLAVRPRIELLEEKLAPATFTWTGAGLTPKWSEAANWDQGTQAPTSGDDLIFPSDITGSYSSTNDLSDAAFSSITIADARYELQGNPLSLGGGLSYTGTSAATYDIATTLTSTASVNDLEGPLAITAPMTLNAPTTFAMAEGAARITLQGGLAGSGALTVNGGTLTVIGGTYSGVPTMDSGSLVRIIPYSCVYDGTPHTATGTWTTPDGNVQSLDLSSTIHADANSYIDYCYYFDILTSQYIELNFNDVISPAPLTATIGNTPTKIYDRTASATLIASDFSLSGLVGGDGFTVTKTSGEYNSRDVWAATTVTTALAPGDFTPVGETLASNYILPTSASGEGKITPIRVAVSGITAQSRAYDGTTAATIDATGATLKGVVPGDAVSVDAAGASAAFADKDAGPGKAVTIHGLSLGGAQAGDYMISPTLIATADITPRGLTAAIVGDPSKPYDGTTAATLTTANFQLGNLAEGEGFAVAQTAGAYNAKDVATAATVTAALDAGQFTPAEGTLADNYVLPTSAVGAGHITRRELSAAIVGDPSKAYDGTQAATLTPEDYSLGNLVDGEGFAVAQAVGAYNSKDVAGADTVTADLAPGDFTPIGSTLASNYSLPTGAAGAGHITRATVTVEGVTAFDKTYDGTAAAAIDATKAILKGAVPGDAVNVDDAGASGSFADKDAGPGKAVTIHGLSLGGADAGNYVISADPTATAAITKAELTVKADDAVRYYGQLNPGFTASYSGFVNGENLSNSGVTGSPSLTTTAVQASPPGAYPVNAAVGSLAASNYSFKLADGTLTVLASQVQTSTTTTTSSALLSYGQAVTFTARVGADMAGANPTGMVVFYDGNTGIGLGTVSSGVATMTTSSLPLGAHQIWARYLGDNTYLPSQSTAVFEAVRPSSTATTLVVQQAANGRGFILDARTTPPWNGGGTITGSMVFFVNGRPFRSVPLVNGGAQWFLPTRTAVRKWFSASFRSNTAAYVNSASTPAFVRRPPVRTAVRQPVGMTARTGSAVAQASPSTIVVATPGRANGPTAVGVPPRAISAVKNWLSTRRGR